MDDGAADRGCRAVSGSVCRLGGNSRISQTGLDELRHRIRLPAVIGRLVRLERAGRQFKGCCPFHAEKSPSFYVYADHFHCFGCGAHGDALDFVMRTETVSFFQAVRLLVAEAGMDPTREASHAAHSLRADAAAMAATRDSGTSGLARRVWSESLVPSGTIVATYLAGRGLTLPDEAPVRFHPACPRGSERVPAMVALMTDATTGRPVGVHRTFLRRDGCGKAAGVAKMMLGGAGVIRLVPDAHVATGLGLAEGIETALAVMQRTGWRPVWATSSAGGMASFPVLPAIDAVTLFADRDDTGAGLKAARSAAARWIAAGRQCEIQLPPSGADWFDALLRPDVTT